MTDKNGRRVPFLGATFLRASKKGGWKVVTGLIIQHHKLRETLFIPTRKSEEPVFLLTT